MYTAFKYFIFPFVVLSFLIQGILAPITVRADTRPTSSNFMVLTDIHFNPFASCPANQPNCQIALKLKNSGANEWSIIFKAYDNKAYSRYYQDTSYRLLTSALNEAKKLNAQYQPQFILNPGDFLAHNFCQQYAAFTSDNSQMGCAVFARKTMAFLAQQLKDTFQNTPLYAALGNDDSYTGDYSIQPEGRFLSDTAITWSGFFKNQSNKINFLKQFTTAGYYEIMPPNSLNDRIIVLDTTPFSPEATSNGNLQQIALEELNWLNQKLQMAKIFHRRVWLLLHIPVGIDVYASLQAKHTVTYWKKPYTTVFLRLLQQYDSVIYGIFAGHAHMDLFSVITNESKHPISLVVSPSISPIFGNNPGIKIITYNADKFNANDYFVYELNLNTKNNSPRWNEEYDFDQTYQPACANAGKHCTLNQSLKRVSDSAAFKNGIYAQAYQNYYEDSSNEDSPIFHQYKNYWCATKNVDAKDYEDCLQQKT